MSIQSLPSFALRVCGGAAILALAGCAQTAEIAGQVSTSINQTVAGLGQRVAGAGSGASSRQPATPLPTQLEGLFRDKPYSKGRQVYSREAGYDMDAGNYPRVALTVLSVPPNYRKGTGCVTPGFTSNDTTCHIPEGCMDIRAVVWRTEKQREDLVFKWCAPDHVAEGVPLIGATQWWVRDKYANLNTGAARTEGPIPPKSSWPTDLDHQRFMGSAQLAQSTATSNMVSLMFASLLYTMRFEWSNTDDPRVWIAAIAPARQ